MKELESPDFIDGEGTLSPGDSEIKENVYPNLAIELEWKVFFGCESRRQDRLIREIEPLSPSIWPNIKQPII